MGCGCEEVGLGCGVGGLLGDCVWFCGGGKELSGVGDGMRVVVGLFWGCVVLRYGCSLWFGGFGWCCGADYW